MEKTIIPFQSFLLINRKIWYESSIIKPALSCHDLISSNSFFIVGMLEICERPASPALMERRGIGLKCTQLLGRAAPYHTLEPNVKAH